MAREQARGFGPRGDAALDHLDGVCMDVQCIAESSMVRHRLWTQPCGRSGPRTLGPVAARSEQADTRCVGVHGSVLAHSLGYSYI